MNIIFFAHPSFLGQQSMPRFARMLADGMAARGHTVDIWAPTPRFFRMNSNAFIRKWLGYIDQFLVFPQEVRKAIKKWPSDTLFVFTDQALGPWVPGLADHPHVIHCHDFMALHSALGKIDENPTGWTGRQYQKLIRRGYSHGKHFISVSRKTRDDLQESLRHEPRSSDVVYNGFHQPYRPEDLTSARDSFGKRTKMNFNSGYILHVGGNSWYKNRRGVVEIYDAWRTHTATPLPLVMVGHAPTKELLSRSESSPYKKDIHWFSGIEDEYVRHAYAGATVFLFPSLGEGFGWPIAEAMASGCPVITTGEAPMTEVAGEAAFLIPRRANNNDGTEWATNAARIVEKLVTMSSDERQSVVDAGLQNAKRFDTENTLNEIENIYKKILRQEAETK